MDHSVIIVGAGPVGMMLAHELGLAGVDTLVLERHRDADAESPGLTMNAGSIELFEQRGLMDALRDYRMVRGVQFSFLWLDASKMNGRGADIAVVPHTHLRKVLEEKSTELGVTVRRGCEVTSLTQQENGVTVGVQTDNGIKEMTCRYLVGCDGRDSVVRKLAGVEFEGSEPEAFLGLVGDVEMNEADLLPDQIGPHHNPSGNQYLGFPLEPGVVRFILGEFDTKPPASDEPVTMDELNESIRRLTGAALKGGKARWLARWTNPSRYAKDYRQGNIFLAGDAAHVHFPTNGQALTTGIYDAVNLGWKIAASVHGWAPDGLLATYHEERYPAGRWACISTEAQQVLSYPVDKVGPLREVFTELLQYEDVNRHLINKVSGIDIYYPLDRKNNRSGAESHPLVGHRLANIPLKTTVGDSDVASLLNAARGVVLDLSGAAVNLSQVAKAWADRVDVVQAEATAEIPAVALLIRPDGYVAWADSENRGEEDLQTALRTWFGAPVS